jgi:CheY-like chemotaxis protein
VGPGALRLVVVPIGCGQHDGVLIAGSRQATFPSEEGRLFLTAGANQAAAVLQHRHADLLRGLRVLVVDDNPTNRHILGEWLTGWRMVPVVVGDGLTALGALWDAVADGRPFPLVLLDARMPDTDGLALAARIRERPALAAVRIILLTSDHRPGDAARARQLRIDARLLKPVQQDELLEMIYRVMSRAQGDMPTAGEGPAREPVAAPAAAPLQILLAEDEGSDDDDPGG